jgi:predicted permease
MSWVRRFRNLFREERIHEEFEDELRFHLEERAAELAAQGVEPQQAWRQARQRFGNPLARREDMRDVKIIRWMADLHQDLRYASRMMRRHPGMSLAAVASLALAIGANCAVFAVLNALVLKPLPVRDPGSLVHLYVPLSIEGSRNRSEDDSFSYPLFLKMRDRADGAADLFATGLVNPVEVSLPGDAQPLYLRYQHISGNAFRILGVGPAHGRVLEPDDDIYPGGHPVAVLSYQMWQQLGKDPDVVGRSLLLKGRSFQVIGVTSKGFSGIDVGAMPDVWIPLTMWQPTEGLMSPDWRNFRIMGRMREGVAREQLTARMQAVYSDALKDKVTRAFPDGNFPEQAQKYLSLQIAVRPAPSGPSRLRGQFLDSLLLLAGVAGLVLLVACCNVANLLLARAAARRNEMAMRLSLGAAKGRLLRQMLAESLLLGALASAAGLLLALRAAPSVVGLLAESNNPVRVALDADWRLFGFLLFTCLVTTLACGLVPALRAFGTEPNAELRGIRVRSSGPLAGRLLVVAQVAMSFVLVGASIVFALSLRNLLTFDAGFNRDDVVLAQVERTGAAEETSRVKATWENLRLRMQEIPGVRSCAYSKWGLFSGNRRTAFFGLPGEPATAIETINLGVSPGFFEAMGTRLLRGRDFLPGDDRGEPASIIVNQAVARRLFPGGEPIGKFMQLGLNEGGPKFRVVGIVDDAKYYDIREAAPPLIYFPEEGSKQVTFALRTAAGTSGLSEQLRAALRQSGTELRLGVVHTQGEAVERTLVRERLLAKLSGLFALLGIVLASIGVYGVLSYYVARRTKEIGIRSALGASRATLAMNVFAHLSPAFLAGMGTGVLLTLPLARFAESLVFGIGPRDPLAFALTGAILAVAGFFSALLPAFRALRIDPAVSLRWE